MPNTIFAPHFACCSGLSSATLALIGVPHLCCSNIRCAVSETPECDNHCRSLGQANLYDPRVLVLRMVLCRCIRDLQIYPRNQTIEMIGLAADTFRAHSVLGGGGDGNPNLVQRPRSPLVWPFNGARRHSADMDGRGTFSAVPSHIALNGSECAARMHRWRSACCHRPKRRCQRVGCPASLWGRVRRSAYASSPAVRGVLVLEH